MREMMAAVSRFYTDLQGTIVSAGIGNNYTLTTTTIHAALADQSPVVFRADRVNTGAATLNVDSLGAKELVKAGGTALAFGDIAQNQLCLVAYNPNQDHYELLNPVDQDETMPAASDSTAGIIEVAVQSEQEAASSTTLAVTPGRQHHHPSALKAWCAANVSGSIQDSYNVASVSDDGVGQITFTIGTDFSSDDFAAVVCPEDTSIFLFSQVQTQSRGSTRAVSANASQSFADPDFWYMMASGDQ